LPNKPSPKKQTPKKPKQSQRQATTEKWEIKADRTKEFYTVQKKKMIKVDDVIELGIVNHRKGVGYQGELLVVYNSGERGWCFLHGAYQALPEVVSYYMLQHKLTYERMGYIDFEQSKQTNTKTLEQDETTETDTKKQADETNTTTLEPQKELNSADTNKKANETNTTTLEPQKQLNSDDTNKKADETNTTTLEPQKQLNSDDTKKQADETNTTTLEPQKELNSDDTKKQADEANASNASVSESDSYYKYQFVCRWNHCDYKKLVSMDNSAYCGNGARFDGVHCADANCQKLFVKINPKKGDDTCFKPTIATPLYCCENNKERCTYAICHDCYKHYVE